MPNAPARACPRSPCPNMVPCSTHGAKARRRELDQHRGSARARGYDNRWDKARKTFLGANPLCVHCKAEGRVVAASVVDHVIPHRGDRALFWNPSNLQGLCAPCHARKTARESAIVACPCTLVLDVMGEPTCTLCGTKARAA
jgi:5-methylcytosine-specific restriction protein A